MVFGCSCGPRAYRLAALCHKRALARMSAEYNLWLLST